MRSMRHLLRQSVIVMYSNSHGCRYERLRGHLLVGIVLLLLGAGIQAQTLHLKTEHYPPYNIDLVRTGESDVAKIGGASTEIIVELMRRSRYDYTMELLPWARSYAMAQAKSLTGVFSTSRTEKREALFKWVGPIQENDYVLLGTSRRNIKLNSLEEAKNYTIGTYRDSAASGMLLEANIKPELVRSDHLNIMKLKRNRIDLWIAGNLYGRYLAKQYGVTGLQQAYTVKKRYMYIAFNKSTPDLIINKLNDILAVMRKEGFIETVNARYQ